ncbi:heavy metal translocating P-type ATPase [Clostridium saccharobutylicum]|uniref:CadA: cadmium, zinc and cobalt-transporting ATPase n=1 Tax=Clostridium saccharobutylicum DSM 13864 TaxID=1345695 RepID=U5MQA4_CLOSA|nr:heavy metal translocating P-type ATPase [Clostridium saccharobutylicum]AGX42770.1 cadA: cadmium, zinc and cobalt-transporting ATPase [Clostridium saccharobutylicum DSM 13864]AQR90066.1 cadmium, zinc and cobalt-transporting ATPase [Clostridium saccharobutylicum]AQR99971.1 cadmium, zinc and cobalt-transporting ATPase [Clostridium saccharobutylicum]AQS09756.1 cadmium, zinc and cobalt-transporting ATPase [Clostridium saccharobutylicum]AQS13955.1 cadmium, zinc and cobalt-transporting ATPase [Clo
MTSNIKIVKGPTKAKLSNKNDIKNIKKEFILEGLGCANCANKMEQQINELEGIHSANVNFITKTLILEIKETNKVEELIKSVTNIVTNIESHVKVKEKELKKVLKKEILLEGLCCANCAAKIERECNKIEDVKCAVVDFIKAKLIIEINNPSKQNDIIENVKKIVKKIEPDVNVIVIENSNNQVQNKEENENNKSEIIRLCIGAIIFGIATVMKFSNLIELIMYLVSYLLVGGEVILRALKNISRGQVFDENFLMGIATIGAFAIGEYPEGVAVMLFYQIGEIFQDMAVDRSRKSISALMDIRPDFASLKINGDIKKVSPEEVGIGDVIIVKPGEKVPLDGKVIEGNSMVDTAALTGESVPREVGVGDSILGGVINKNGLLTIKVEKEFGDSTIAKILDLVQNASSKKSPTENFITKFARYYTPAVVFAALALAIIPPLVIDGATFSSWIYRALAFLVVSCPCALVVSIPLGFFGGIGGASKNGILVKGGNYLEALNDVEMVVFDKTGTLTKGVFKVTEIKPENNISKDELIACAAYAENYSNHPIATSILKAYGEEIIKDKIKGYEEISGYGVKVLLEGKEVLAGNYKLMDKENISYNAVETIGTVVHVSINKRYAGYIIISDEVKSDSKSAIRALKEIGVKRTVMLTGDNKAVGSKISKELGVDEVYAELLPDQKVDKLEALYNEKSPKGKIIFVGDGINDAPVLARADIGIAMGGVGSDAAIEAADVVIMTDEPSKIASAIKIAKKTRTIVMQNIIFALTIKLIILVLVAFGLGTMWEAVFGDVGVALLAVLNAMRAMKVENL